MLPTVCACDCLWGGRSGVAAFNPGMGVTYSHKQPRSKIISSQNMVGYTFLYKFSDDIIKI